MCWWAEESGNVHGAACTEMGASVAAFAPGGPKSQALVQARAKYVWEGYHRWPWRIPSLRVFMSSFTSPFSDIQH
jgi:hypothetical protein